MTKPLSRAEFLVRAVRTHGKKYGYGKSNYKNMHQKIDVECPEHGVFSQSPANHLSGKGCPTCAYKTISSKQAKTDQQFVFQAKKKFGKKFSYSKVKYINQNTPVVISCPKHGDFSVSPKTFLKSPHGCRKCRFDIPFSTKDFVKRAKSKNGAQCDYSKTRYTGYTEEVLIICRKHGAFSQRADRHLKSKTSGCPECIRSNARISHKSHGISEIIDTELFIRRSAEAHAGKYSYEKTIYVNNYTKVIVTCPAHGDFQTNPNNHSRKKNPSGCPKCAHELARETRRFTKDQFIKAASQKHGGRYSYANVSYHNARRKVEIECPRHGPFLQEPFSHLKGIGCPECGREIISIGSTIEDYIKSGEQRLASIYLILAKRSQEEFLKIGITTKTLAHRFAPSAFPYEFETVVCEEVDIAEAYLLEQGVLEKFKKNFHYWPQLDFGGRTECFQTNSKDEIVSFLGFEKNIPSK
jgi:hypothetical protein